MNGSFAGSIPACGPCPMIFPIFGSSAPQPTCGLPGWGSGRFLGALLPVRPPVWERTFRLFCPERPQSLRPILVLALLASSVTAYALQPFVDHSNPDLSAMTFSELEYAEGVTCSHRSAQVTPCTDSVLSRERLPMSFKTPPGKSRPSPLPSIRATPSPPSGLTERRFPSGSAIIRSTMRPCWK